MSEPRKPEPDGATFRPPCVSVDLEVGKDDRIHALAAVRPDTGRSLTHLDGDLAAALAKLDGVAEGASFVLGHNLIAFDLPHLKAAKPNLRLLDLPAVDTLRLSPLAFPRNPYHSLVKHYQDGGLRSGRRNDPEWDARIALDLFGDEREALAKAAPDLLAAWHWLCTPEPMGVDRALDGLFSQLRQASRPAQTEARAAIGRRLENAACATQAREVIADAVTFGWPLAYALAWLSVGRVQSVALRLVCEREAEIAAFRPRAFWTVAADIETRVGAGFPAALVRLDGATIGEAGFDEEASPCRSTPIRLPHVEPSSMVSAIVPRASATRSSSSSSRSSSSNSSRLSVAIT